MADYHSIIARAVSRLPSKTDEARRAIYDRARTALRETLCNFDPPLSETELANEEAALDETIGVVEVDFLFSEIRSTDIRRGPKEAAPPPPSSALSTRSLSFISRLKEFVRSIGDKFK
jgi:hypothetical protein